MSSNFKWVIGFIFLLGMVSIFTVSYLSGYRNGAKNAELIYLNQIKAINEVARATEDALNYEMSQVRKYAYEQQIQSEEAISDAHDSISRLQQTIANQQRQLKSKLATTASGVDGSITTCWRVLSESVEEYRKMGQDADRLVERLRIGQGWAKTIEGVKPIGNTYNIVP